MQVVGKPRGNATWSAETKPFLKLLSPYTGGQWSSYSNSTSVQVANWPTISQTCEAARPNVLDFGGTQNFTLEMWTYPKHADMPVDLGWCVAAFFLLSFGFQLMLEILGTVGVSSLRYTNMFDPAQSSDRMEWDEKNLAMANRDNGQDLSSCLARELHFNWLRFIEYSGSGSLVLFTIALLAGIVDIELLICMFALSFTCMILGIVAEFALRAKVRSSLFRCTFLQATT